MARLATTRTSALSLALLFAASACVEPQALPPVSPATPPAAPPQKGPLSFLPAARPKLVVVIAIDQFRADFLTRLDPHLSDKGFRRLLREGASFTGHYGHYATYTGPGHALMLSGSYPYVNGISTNKFWNPASQRSEAMVFDAASQVLGAPQTDADMDVSPRNFLGSTIGDELALATGGKSKTISLATKGRGAILLGGRLGKTFWMNEDNGEMTTSTYYHKALPGWVSAWNKKKVADSYFGKSWERLLPEAAYATSMPDDAAFEGGSKGLGKTFPHKVTGKLSAPGPGFYQALCLTPFANEWELDFAKAAVEGEQLGARGVTDLLAISLSATDLAGHDFGPMSQEVEDIVVRVDRQIGEFLDWIHTKVGKDEVLVVVSADHGATPVPEQLSAMGFSAGRIKKKTIGDAIEAALDAKYGPAEAAAPKPAAKPPAKPGVAKPADEKPEEKAEKKKAKWVLAMEDPHIFLNRGLIAERKLDASEVQRIAGDAAASIEGFGGYFTRDQLVHGQVPDTALGHALLRTYFVPRGGDVVMWTLPFYFWGKYAEKEAGSTHGTFYRYDTDVPVFLLGAAIKPGHYGTHEMIDLAPTLGYLLGVARPAGSEGAVLPVSQAH